MVQVRLGQKYFLLPNQTHDLQVKGSTVHVRDLGDLWTSVIIYLAQVTRHPVFALFCSLATPTDTQPLQCLPDPKSEPWLPGYIIDIVQSHSEFIWTACFVFFSPPDFLLDWFEREGFDNVTGEDVTVRYKAQE